MAIDASHNLGDTNHVAVHNEVDTAILTLQDTVPEDGLFSARPAANSVPDGYIYYATDRGEVFQSNNVVWTSVLVGGDNSRLLPDGETAILRSSLNGNTIGTATQALKLTYFTAQRSETITQIRLYVGGTAAAATPTLTRLGVWTAGNDGALLAQVAATTSDTALLTGSTNSRRTKSFASSFAKARGTRYAVGVLVVSAAATPTFGGLFIANAAISQISGDSQRWAGQINSQSDLPSTAVAGSVIDGTSAVQFELLQ